MYLVLIDNNFFLSHNIVNSFDYLHNQGMITAPDDSGKLTKRGEFVSSLSCGIELGKLISLAACFGVLTDGVILAAALSLPRTPFRCASPLIHKDANVFNDLVRTTFLAANYFDKGRYSEPFMLMEMLKSYRDIPRNERDKFCSKFGIWSKYLKSFENSAQALHQQAIRTLDRSKNRKGTLHLGALSMDSTSENQSQEEVCNILRLIMLWSFPSSNIMTMKYCHQKSKNSIMISNNPTLTKTQLDSLFPPDIIPYKISIIGDTRYILQSLNALEYGSRYTMKEILECVISTIAGKDTSGNVDLPVPLIWVLNQTDYHVALLVSNDKKVNENLTRIEELLSGCMEEIDKKFYSGDNNIQSQYVYYKVSLQDERRFKKFSKSFKEIQKSFSIQAVSLYIMKGMKLEIIAKNCKIDLDVLHSMFKNEFSQEDNKIVVKQACEGQFLTFLNSPQENTVANPFIPDVCIGLRLLRAYESGNFRCVIFNYHLL